LRALEHLDALELAEIAEAHAVARPVDAVDDDADGGFQARIVADRADAADTRGRDGFARRRGDDEARRQQSEILDVLDTGVLQELCGDGGDDDRHVLQALLALLRSDDNGVERAIVSVFSVLGRERHAHGAERRKDRASQQDAL